MTIDEFCYLVDKRKRKILKSLPGTEIGETLAEKITRSMHYKTSFVLEAQELELLAELHPTRGASALFAEEIAKSGKSIKSKMAPNA